MTEFKNDYPENWAEIARAVKDAAGWKCVRCGHPHEPQNGYCLTVHHLDGNKSNCEWFNLPALCQRCHLEIQARVDMNRIWFFEHSSWFVPYVAGFYAKLRGLPTDRDYIRQNADDLIDFRNLSGQKDAECP